MKIKCKKLFATFFALQMLFIVPIIAESVTGIGSDEISQANTALVIDSLHTQEPPGTPPGEIWVTSYYSNAFHGRRTASGEVYDKNALTCAHKTLPFQTNLKVTNPQTGKSIIVRVNDRGPFYRGRDLDLSYAAAQEIGMIAAGVMKLEVVVLPEETVPADLSLNQP
jgi:hypothetical protein